MAHFLDSDGDMTRQNGWSFTTKAGTYGTNYIQRALITAIGLGANRPQDAIYPTLAQARPARGLLRRAQVHDGLPKGQRPPVKGFWSLTMYDEQMFFVANPINRYSMSVRTNPKMGEDGSLTIYIQNETPGATSRPTGCPRPRASST